MASYQKTAEAVAALSSEDYRGTQQSGGEHAATGPLLSNKQAGLDVDIVSGEPLFASSDRFESDCGWPIFTNPVEPAHVAELRNASRGMARTEVRSTHGESHLGHIFDDGPRDRGGLRYCINSASLRFSPPEDMEAQGHGIYLKQVKEVG